jgi:hypothetical protein
VFVPIAASMEGVGSFILKIRYVIENYKFRAFDIRAVQSH